MKFTKLLVISSLFVSSLFAASYNVDRAHSNIGFKVKHMMISNVKGTFSDFEGTFDYDEKTKKLTALYGEIQVESIDTANKKRDTHLREEEIFDADEYPAITFKMTKMDGDNVYGDFTLKGVTKNIKLEYENGGTIVDPWGNERAGFSLEGKIKRADFGLTYNSVLEAGGFAIGEDVKLEIEIEGIKAK
ncbi:MAG: YceI family protein [Sulfurimonas sp.]|uniref:YceI family protein n=1 Tax=Sulfurimonas sp. TaxID=2022749 RepID=UPI0025E6D7C9|nr:YceI family protein [Sulfurimonas sp.]MCK9492436.1 YceI family protein [Sulfurimonas sp.]